MSQQRHVGFTENVFDPITHTVRQASPPSGRRRHFCTGRLVLPYMQPEETMKVVYTVGVYSAGMSTSEASTMYVERLGQGQTLGLCRIDYIEPMNVKYTFTPEGQVKVIKFRVVGYEPVTVHRRSPEHADLTWLASSPDDVGPSPSPDEPPSEYAGRATEDHAIFDAFDARRWTPTLRDRTTTPNRSLTLSTSSRITAASQASTAASARRVVETLEQERSADDNAEGLHRAALTLRTPEPAQPQHDYIVPRRRCCGVDLTNVDQIFYDYLRGLGLQHDEALIAHPGIKLPKRTAAAGSSERSDETVDSELANARPEDEPLPVPQHPPKSFQAPPPSKSPPPNIPSDSTVAG